MSRLMGYGRQDQITKLGYASFAASLAYPAAAAKRSGGLLLHSQEQKVYIPRRRRAPGDLCHALEASKASGGTALADGLSFLSEVVRRRGVVVVLSDLLPSPPALGELPGELPIDHISKYGARCGRSYGAASPEAST